MKEDKRNYIIDASVDGQLKHYTVKNVTKRFVNRTAYNVGVSLFGTECIRIISLNKIV